jgi:hypothetical protein
VLSQPKLDVCFSVIVPVAGLMLLHWTLIDGVFVAPMIAPPDTVQAYEIVPELAVCVGMLLL